MPGKMVRSRPSTIARAVQRAGSHPHLRCVWRKGRKSGNICVRSGIIRGNPVEMK